MRGLKVRNFAPNREITPGSVGVRDRPLSDPRNEGRTPGPSASSPDGQAPGWPGVLVPLSGAIPSSTGGVLGTSRPGKGSLPLGLRKTLAGAGEPESGQSLGDGMA